MEVKTAALPVPQQQVLGHGTGSLHVQNSAASSHARSEMGHLQLKESRLLGLAKEPVVEEGTELKATSPSLSNPRSQSRAPHADFTQPLLSERTLQPSLSNTRGLKIFLNTPRLMKEAIQEP